VFNFLQSDDVTSLRFDGRRALRLVFGLRKRMIARKRQSEGKRADCNSGSQGIGSLGRN
jgi:hypothetical protein